MEIEHVDRLACQSACGFIHWDNPIPVVAALVQFEDKFILARNKEWPEGFYSLISGFIESGESPLDSVLRETTEELGLQVESSEFIDHYYFSKLNQLILAYCVKAKGNILLNDELIDYKLLTKQELIEYDFGVLKLGKYVVKKWHSFHSMENNYSVAAG